MIKKDLIESLLYEKSISKKQAKDVINLIFNDITTALKKGERVNIRSLGSFSVKKSDAYKRRDLKTGKLIKVNPSKIPVFRMGKEMYECINYITPKKIDKIIHYCNSYNRLPTLIDAYDNNKITLKELLIAFRDKWSSFDNISCYMEDIERIIFDFDYQTIDLMMNLEEQKFYKELPDTLTIYRGCDKKNIYGLCWSLDRDIAIEFPFLKRYKAKNPVLVTTTVYKHEILAVKLDRNEKEVITLKQDDNIKVKPLTESDRNPKIAEKKHIESMELIKKYT